MDVFVKFCIHSCVFKITLQKYQLKKIKKYQKLLIYFNSFFGEIPK